MKKLLAISALFVLSLAVVSCNSSSSDIDYTIAVCGFEDMPSTMVASDVYGANLYGQGYYWLDKATGLGSKPVQDQFYSGGTAISAYGAAELTASNYADWYKYQMAVRNTTAGVANSAHSLVSFGYKDPDGWNHCPKLTFTDSPETERIIVGLCVCNTSYPYAYMTTDVGSGIPKEQTDFYFKVIFRGYDKAGNLTGTVEHYLADSRAKSSIPGGIVNGWSDVTLLSLGYVHYIEIDMDSSDWGTYGMNVPAYVAIDNIHVRLDIDETVTPNASNILE